MIAFRLSEYVESKGILLHNQCGFRRQRSTQDQIVHLASDIQEAFSQKQHLFSVFFDIEKAYDTTWHYNILKKLLEIGLSGRITQFINNYLHNRIICVRINNSLSNPTPVENGVPQGGVLSILCFLLAINNIAEYIPHPIKYRLYADDLNISLRTKNPKLAENLLQACLQNLENWSNSTGFKFAEHKTYCVDFSRKHQEKKLQLKLNNIQLDFHHEASFLGLKFDRRLHWTSFLKELRSSTQKRLNVLKMLRNKTFGPSPHLLLRIYRTLIRSKIDYGATAYLSASNSLLQILDPIHNAGIRIALRAFCTSPINSMQLLCGEPPLEVRRKLLTLKYCLSVANNPSHPNYSLVYKPGCSKISITFHHLKNVYNINDNVCPAILKKTIFDHWLNQISHLPHQLIKIKKIHRIGQN